MPHNESEDRYRILTDSLPQLMWTADAGGNVNYANKRCIDYTGLPSQEKFGQGWVSSIHPEDFPDVAQAWMKAMETANPFNEEYRMKGADGTYRWFLGRAVPIMLKNGKVDYWISSATDIDVQKQSIENLEHERILREQFVATLSHDLKNPLSAAKTAAHMIGKYSNSPEKLVSLSGRVVDNLNRAAQMIDNLLDANRIKAGFKLELDLEEMELCSLVSETLNDLISIHGDRFVLRTTDEVINGYWSPDGIRRVVENLCTNAIKYGSIQDKVTVRLTKSTSDITISVHNFGNPLEEKVTSDLFAPFQRVNSKLKPESKGWGLGLTIVKGIAESLGGSISVMSSSSEGTTFVFKIPENQQVK
ncbi:MAG: PAS domain-containing sensor histidine kinase [Rhizobacter sp.]|nr:PAS domain-containing sensor histidine kinase [Bacteriovorax sp.]